MFIKRGDAEEIIKVIDNSEEHDMEAKKLLSKTKKEAKETEINMEKNAN